MMAGLGIDLNQFNAQTARNESGGRNLGYHNLARSTASGLYGITDTTWGGLMRNYPQLGLTWDNKSDPEAQTRAKNALTEESAAGLRAAGLEVNEPNLGMVAFLGPRAAHAVLKAPSQALAYDIIRGATSQVTADQFAKSNPEILHQGATVGDLQDLAGRTFGGRGGGAVAPTTDASQATPGPPAGPAPPINPLVTKPTPTDFSWLPPPTAVPSVQPNPLISPAVMLAGLAASHKAVQVDYNPFALQPKV